MGKTAADMASFLILALGIGDRCFHCEEQDRGIRDKRQATGSRKGLILQGVGERGRAKIGSARAQTSAQFRNTFHFLLIKQLIFNYKSEAGSPHEMSSVIYQKKSSLGR